MTVGLLECCLDQALAEEPELVKAEMLKLLRRVAELELLVARYREKYGSWTPVIFPFRGYTRPGA